MIDDEFNAQSSVTIKDITNKSEMMFIQNSNDRENVIVVIGRSEFTSRSTFSKEELLVAFRYILDKKEDSI